MPQQGFDVNAARQAGYSDDEILQHLTQTRNFDVQAAQRSGYSSAEIVNYLAGSPALPNAGLAQPARPNVNMRQSPWGATDYSDPSLPQFGGMHGGSYDIMLQNGQQRFAPNSPQMGAAALGGTLGAATGAAAMASPEAVQVASDFATAHPVAAWLAKKGLGGLATGLGVGVGARAALKHWGSLADLLQ